MRLVSRDDSAPLAKTLMPWIKVWVDFSPRTRSNTVAIILTVIGFVALHYGLGIG